MKSTFVPAGTVAGSVGPATVNSSAWAPATPMEPTASGALPVFRTVNVRTTGAAPVPVVPKSVWSPESGSASPSAITRPLPTRAISATGGRTSWTVKVTETEFVLPEASTAWTRIARAPGSWRAPAATDWEYTTGPLQSVAVASAARSGTIPSTPGATLVETSAGIRVKTGARTSRTTTTLVAKAAAPSEPVTVVTFV